MTAARVLGGGSLALLGVSLVLGPIRWVDLGLEPAAALGLDAALAAVFAVQHSMMIRRSFQQRLAAKVPAHLQAATYAIASGVTLLLMLALWQPGLPGMITIGGIGRWLLRGLVVAAGAIFAWGIHALRSFDGLGLGPIRAFLRGRPLRSQLLTIRGPYRWVRHPLYLAVLLVLWSEPDLSGDRLVLNLVWSVWVVVGSVLEERDLVAAFGDTYRDYQREVGMLLPRGLRAYRPPPPIG